MALSPRVIYEVKTDLDTYQVVERIYSNRPSRLLYASKSYSAQSGIALDDSDLMLFGYNQRLVELLDKANPKEVLLIGGGVYTLPTYITSKYPSIKLDVVEPDKGLEDIARRFFNFQPTLNIKVINDYGLHFLKTNNKTYDLVIIDAFSGYEIPDEVFSRKFAKYAAESIKDGGLLAANVISNLSPNSVLNKMHETYSKYFKYFEVFPAERESAYFSPTNLIYVASTSQIKIRLLYSPLSRANFSTS